MALGILCLETYWSDDIEDRRSVRGLLETLEHNVDGLVADHRHVADRRDIRAHLQGIWRDHRYDVLYVAAHGKSGGVLDEDGSRLTLRWLGSKLESACEGRVIFLAGCETARVGDLTAKRFLGTTGAAALVGYERSVDWLEAAQMDLITLAALASPGPDAMGRWPKEPGEILRVIAEDHPGMVRRLGWKPCRGVYARRDRRRSPDGLDEAIGLLVKLARDGSVEASVRESAVRAAGQLNALPGSLSSLARDARHPTRVRRAAIVALRQSKVRGAASVLTRLTSSLEEKPDGSDTRSLLGEAKPR